MIVSVCVIGLNDQAIDFISKFKSRNYYKQSDEEEVAARIHFIHVASFSGLYGTYYHEKPDETVGKIVSYKDGEEETSRRIPLGSDLEFLTETDGHRTIVEFIEKDPEEYLEAIRSQFKEGGYDLHITSESLMPYREEFESLADEVGAKVFFYTGESAVEEVLSYLDTKFEKEASLYGEPCGLDMDGVDWS